ncbi:LOW QUALITY PROTEIN: uncharacterized protein ACMZJ9_003479 [Mantella aurantiaca]
MELSVLVLLVVIPAYLAQEDLENKVFVFPKESNTAHVILRPLTTKSLKEVSVCLRSYTDLTRPYAPFSLATPGKDNAFLIYFQPPNICIVYINQEAINIKTDSESLDWRHTCVTWDSDTGIVQLWANGKLYPRKVSMKGSSIAAEHSIILGQEQDSFGGAFDASQSLVGDISDVHMWDYVLTPEDVQKVISGELHGNFLNWKSLLYEMKGEALVQYKDLHLESKVFVFPKETKTAHVVLRPMTTKSLQKVSVCLWSYTDLSRPYTTFSLATPGKDNAFLIYFQPPNICTVHINQDAVTIKTDPESLDWRHTCVTWDSDTGIVQLWVNGKLYPRKISMKGSSIATESSIVLGQDQDSFCGGFDASQSFVGEISDVHMWDYVLNSGDVQKVISGDLQGNLINWKSLLHRMRGEVLVLPKSMQIKNKVFVFPKETNKAHVILRPTTTKSLQKVSVCLRYYTDLSRPYTPFSLATPGKDNAFLIYFQPPNICTVHINQDAVTIKTDPESLDWRHTCVTWDSYTGIVKLWVNGKLYPRKISMKGSSIAAESSIVLGQEQDSFGGGFDASQSLVGEISDVHMWDYVLNSGDVQKVTSGYLRGNIINWKSLLYEMRGEVLVQPNNDSPVFSFLDLENKVFVFPNGTNTAHIILRPPTTKSLQKVSVCLRTYTDLLRPYAPFSLATPGKDNAFLIFIQPPNICSVYINQKATNIMTDSKSLDWRHTCVTWDSDTGFVQLWVDGKVYPGGVALKGSTIAAESSIVLGQEQDSFGGGFDASQSLVGEISDVHMWDYVLTPEDVQKVISDDLHGNFLNWKSLLYEIRGNAFVQPKNLHLDNKVFVFPKETNTSHVILRPKTTKSLQKVSICLRSYTDLQRTYPIFSLATSEKDNAFLITFQPPNICALYINQEAIHIKIDSQPLDWRHTCVTWDSDTGIVQLWVNGKIYPVAVAMKGSTIAAESSIVLGQEQDSFAGGFDASQSLVGEISDVHMWDYVLTPEDVQKVISGDLHGNFLNWTSPLYEIRGNVFVQPKNQHLENKVFVFRKETNTAHVILRPMTTKSLQKVSVCLRYYTDLSRPYTPFSLATPGKDNAFRITFQAPKKFSVYINQEGIHIITESKPLDWRHTCVTWDSDTGIVQLWVNGKVYPGGVAMKGSSIAAESSIVLGQEQDSFGGGFDASQSLVGEISDVHMWDYVLTPSDIQKVISGDLNGNYLNWKSLHYEIRGNTFIQPKNLHLENKVFVFPKESNTDHVILRPPTTKSLQKVSVCLWSYNDFPLPYAPFCLATPKEDNAFLISFQPPNICSVHINQKTTYNMTDSEPLDWRHTCVTWDSDTGIVQLWANGKFFPGGDAMKGSSIAAESIVLGQEQDSFGGGFDASKSLVGEISNVHMWDYVLTPEDIQKVISDDLHGNFLNWKSLIHEIKGNIFIHPKNLHLENKMFVFPKETNTAQVILRPPTTKSLQKVSICLRSYTDLRRTYPIFSLATPGKDNAFLITYQPSNICALYINQEAININIDSEPLDWRHTCVTWDSNTGIVQLWVNGKFYPGGVAMKGSTIAAESSIVLGQEQDYFGGGFDASQSFVGEISDVHMWDYVLTPEDVQNLISDDLHGNFLNWKSLLCEIRGNAFVEPKSQHLENKVFVFPKETNTAHVILRPPTTKSLQKVSVCLRSYTDLLRPYTAFSLATPGKDNAFLISFQPPNICSVHINQEITNFNINSEPLDWRHTCVTWDSYTGVIQLWVNGKLYPRKVSMKGSSIAAESSIVLGQEQYSFGGGFNASQSLVGEISDVHMWDYVLNPYDIRKVISDDLHGNVISWKALLFEMKGTVIIQPKLQYNFVRSRHIPFSYVLSKASYEVGQIAPPPYSAKGDGTRGKGEKWKEQDMSGSEALICDSNEFPVFSFLDLKYKVFAFPKETNTAHVILRPPTTKSLQKVSVCIRSYTNLQRPYAPFSLATPGKDNALLIYFHPPNIFSVYINQEVTNIITHSDPLDWKHTCVTWDSDTGIVKLSDNGKVYPGGVLMKGSTIAAESSIVLGQEQDSFAGGFDASQSLVGEISDVHMWDYVLTPSDIHVISGKLHGNFLNWKSLLYEIKGNAFVQPKSLHLKNKVFVLPNRAHDIITYKGEWSLQKISVCLHSYSDLLLPYAPFCLAIPERDNAFLIYFQPPNICSVHVKKEATNIKTDTEPLDWRHTCVTWDLDTGIVQLWVNGKIYLTSVAKKGISIAAESSIVLGQEQDSFGGRFAASQPLVGEINDVQMWNYILTPEDIQEFISGDLYGNFHDWKSLLHEIRGNTFVQPKNLLRQSKVLLFPKETNTTHVILIPKTTKSLQNVSVCLRSYTDLSRPYTLFSLATPGKDNAFRIYFQPPNICTVHINQEAIDIKTDSESLDWRHTCVTWDSDTGIVQLWVNGKLYPRKVSMKGSTIDAKSSIVLGQEQDSFGGGFDASQSLVGEISDVHMWDYVLTPSDIQKVISDDLYGNLINWNALFFEMKGTVIFQPKLQNKLEASQHTPSS